MGLDTLEKLEALGFEETCRRWIMYFPERLHAMAFLGVISALEGTVWTQATPSQRAQARALATELRRELGIPTRPHTRRPRAKAGKRR